jgi:hypothetical protein
MSKDRQFGLRLDVDDYDALRRAADHDDRSVGHLLRRIAHEWLISHGWIAAEPKRKTARKGKEPT